jgi:hypothetical protein
LAEAAIESNKLDSTRNSGGSRYIKDKFVIFTSDTLHHSRDKVRGFMYKRGERVNFFNFNAYHKRYFIISAQHQAFYI